jgi:uncharacterized membrane protein
MYLLATLLALHLLAAVFWVGGMAFAYTILRPSAGPLEPPVGLALWRRVFSRFLPAVGVSIVVLLVTGFWMMILMFGGFARSGAYIHLMTTTGIVMMLLYLHLVFAPWRRFKAALDSGTLPEAARRLDQIRMLVAANLVLGVITLIAGGTGRFW